MDVLRFSLPLLLIFVGGTGCQMGYYIKSARSHFSIVWNRMPLDEALQDPRLTESEKAKLKTAQEAQQFALEHLKLKPTKNYTTYSHLDRPYVSWVVSAAQKWKLEPYLWSYPFVGKLPYKGYADENEAKRLKQELEKEGLDTFLRGVSAYSTLGWFHDSLLSSMLRMEEHDLVDTVIHETTHTTLFIKSNADFNERLAVFVGAKGMEQFYLKREGPDSPTLAKVRDSNEDEKLFSDFIGPELKALREWYEQRQDGEKTEELRQARIREIQQKFQREIWPKMKSPRYRRFPEIELNNARLLYYRTYFQDLSVFERLFVLSEDNWTRFFFCAKSLESSKDPEQDLKELNDKLARFEAQGTQPDPCAGGAKK